MGRGAGVDPPNRFERVRAEEDLEQLDPDELPAEPRRVPTVFLPDASRTIIAKNDSPDVPFRYSINPYRGCEHGCAYVMRARPRVSGHERGLGFRDAHPGQARGSAAVARRWPASWRGEAITLSGVTDCYQPAEAPVRLRAAAWK